MKIWRFVIPILLSCSSLGVAQPPPVFIWYGGCSGGARRACVRDSRGWIYVVSSDYYNGRDGYVHCSYSFDNGVNWSLPWTLNFVGANVYGVGPAIAIDRDDSLWGAWKQTYFDSLGRWREDTFWSRYNDSSWTPATNLSNQGLGADDHRPSLVVDPSNHPHVVWDMDGSPYKVFYSRHDGTSWISPEIASDGGSYMPTLAVDSAGNLHLAYYVGNISYRKRVGGVWSASTIIGVGTHPSIVVDFLGHSHVVWTSFVYPYDILYSYFNGTSWSPPLNLSNNMGLSESPTISCDFRNNLYVAWEDNSLDTTKFPRIFRRTYDGASWSLISVISTDTTWPCLSPNIGYPVTDSGVDVVWTQWYNGQWSVMYRRLPLVGSGVEGEKPVEPSGEGLQLSVRSPVRSQLVVRYFLPPSKIQNLKSKISLYDLSGRMVAVLGEGVKPSGWHELKAPLNRPSGVYFLRLEAGNSSLTRKFVLLR
jgi:hypothetical protein